MFSSCPTNWPCFYFHQLTFRFVWYFYSPKKKKKKLACLEICVFHFCSRVKNPKSCMAFTANTELMEKNTFSLRNDSSKLSCLPVGGGHTTLQLTCTRILHWWCLCYRVALALPDSTNSYTKSWITRTSTNLLHEIRIGALFHYLSLASWSFTHQASVTSLTWLTSIPRSHVRKDE